MLLQIPDFEFTTETIDDDNLIGNFNICGNVIKLTKEISFDQDSRLYGMALIEK